MKIGIDARLYGLEHAGIGRYVINLVDRLIQNKDITLTLFVHPKYGDHFRQFPHITIVPTDIKHYSLQEQIVLPSIFKQQHLDLLHVPHFNVPILYNQPFVVTIHDILWHQVKGGSVTTLSPLKYYLKYQGYKYTVAHALHASQKILVPSEYVKNDILQLFKSLDPHKITVTYEGVHNE